MADTPSPSSSSSPPETTPTPIESPPSSESPSSPSPPPPSTESSPPPPSTESVSGEKERISEDVLGGVGLMELATPPNSGDEDEGEDTATSIMNLLGALATPSEAPELTKDFDDEVPKLGKALQKHCYEYSGYLSYPNLILQQVKEADAAAETMLNRLDEVGALTDTVRIESANIRRQVLSLLADCQHLPIMFNLIDKLLVLTAQMNATLDRLEAQVVEAEDENSYSLGSFLTYMGAKRSASETFRKTPIPNTKEYFEQVRTDMIKATQEQMAASSSSSSSSSS